MKALGTEIRETLAGIIHLILNLGWRVLARILRAGIGIMASIRGLGNPLTASRATVVMLFCFVTRTIFSLADPVPGVIPYNPAVGLAAAAAFLWGIAAAWGAAAAMVLADLLCRQWSGITFFRATGIFMLSATIALLAGSEWWKRPGRSIFTALVAACAGTLWDAAGIDLCGYYPFSRMAVLLLAYYSFFTALLGIPLARWYRSRARRAAALAGKNQRGDLMSPPSVMPAFRRGNAVWEWAAIPPVAIAAVVTLEWLLDGFNPAVPALLGSTGGSFSRTLLVAGIGLHAVVFFNLPTELLRAEGPSKGDTLTEVPY